MRTHTTNAGFILRIGDALAVAIVAILSTAGQSAAQIGPQMRDGIPNSKYVPQYSIVQRAEAVQKVMKLASRPKLGRPTSVTPNAPYAKDGSRLSVWKPSFVLGTASGGEIGVNFWGIYNEGHVNVGFEAKPAKSYVLDCRLLSTGSITYKVYSGPGGTLTASGELPLVDGHLLVVVGASAMGGPTSVEIWPTPTNATMGFLGCEISTMN